MNPETDNTTSAGRRPPGMSGVKRIFKSVGVLAGIAAALIAALFLTGGMPGKDDPSPAAGDKPSNVTLTAEQRKSIDLHTVELCKFHKTVQATGTVDFDYEQATTVLAPVGGPVARLLVSLGEHVKADEPLAIVNSPDFAAAISTYRKAIASARTARQIADLDKQLLQHQAISQRDADQAELNAVTAEDDREAAFQALVSLKVDPQIIKALQEGRAFSPVQGVIRSPVAGTVVEKLITPGQLLQAGATPCFTVADLSRVWVMAHLFGSDLTVVSRGDPAKVVTGIGSTIFSGSVDNISSLVDPDTRSVAVRVVVENPGDFLKKGMYVSVQIQARQESRGALLPVAAILRDEENLPFVYLAQPDGSFARRSVTLGIRVGDQCEIKTGVAVGDQVVAEGGLFLQFLESQ